MDYEKDLELCEYNPMSLEYEREIRELARAVKSPAKCFFQKLLKKIILSHALEA